MIVRSGAGQTVGPLWDWAVAAKYPHRVRFTVYFPHDPIRNSFSKHFRYFLCLAATTTLICMNVPFATARSARTISPSLPSSAEKPADNKVILFTESCRMGDSWNLCGTVFNSHKLPGASRRS